MNTCTVHLQRKVSKGKHECYYPIIKVRTYSVVSDPMDCSPPGSSVHGIFQARILEQVAISYSRGIFPTQESNQCLLNLLHWQADSLPLSHLGAEPCTPNLTVPKRQSQDLNPFVWSDFRVFFTFGIVVLIYWD